MEKYNLTAFSKGAELRVRRFPLESIVKYLDGDISTCGLGHGFMFKNNVIYATFGFNDFLFKDGKWAEILPSEDILRIIDGTKIALTNGKYIPSGSYKLVKID